MLSHKGCGRSVPELSDLERLTPTLDCPVFNMTKELNVVKQTLLSVMLV